MRKSNLAISAALLAWSTGAFTTRAAVPVYDEVGGRVVVEAEHFASRIDDPDTHHWHVVPTDDGKDKYGDTPTQAYVNARGNSYITSQPDTAGGGVNHNAVSFVGGPPSVDYKFNINTPGAYRLWLRWKGYDGSSDSIYAQIMEISNPAWYRYAAGVAPTDADFASTTGGIGWDGVAAPSTDSSNMVSGGGGEVPAIYNLAGGTYTLRISMREDGSAVDAFMLQLSSLPDPTNPGPAESGLATSYVAVTVPPADALAAPGKTATFTVTAEGTGALTYQWQSKAPGAADYSNISNATSTSYTTPTATDAMNGTKYRVVISNGTKTVNSSAASLITDATPPSLVQVRGGAAGNSVALDFSEKLDQGTAETSGNYTIAGLTISSAKLTASGTSVVLTTAKQTAGTSYTVSVNGIKDTAGNAMTVAGTGSFTGPTLVPGKILVRFYRNIGGTAVANLTSAATYPNSPDDVQLWDVFSSGDGTGDTFGDNYGLELTGFYTAPASGNYKFYIRSDDASQLLFSTDDTEGGLRQIAAQTGCCNTFTDQPGSLSSQPIALEKGKAYYFKAYLKEGGGGDFIQVGVLGPNDPDINDASAVVPIPTDFLSTGFSKTATLSITKQPAPITVQANTAASFSVGYAANSVFGTKANVQWQRAASGSSAFADIAGATNNTYTIQFPTSADNGSQFRAQVKIDIADSTLGTSTSASSQAATLTISNDTTPPVVTFVSGGVASILVGFNEPLDGASAAAAANYKVSGGVTTSSATVISSAGQAGLVRVALSGVTPGQTYSVTISGVKDTAGNAVASTTLSFDAYHIISTFNDGGVPPGAAINGSANVQATASYDGSGALELTAPAGSLQGSIIYPDIPGVTSVSKFTAFWKMFIGNGSGNPADGFSFVLSPGLDDTANFGEEGTGSGLVFSFDTYDNGNNEAPAISVKYGGLSEDQIADGGNQVIKVHTTKATLVNNQWVDVAVQVTADGKVTVIHNNVKYIDAEPIPGWVPMDAPRAAFGARTGGEYERALIDDVKILFNADVALAQPPTISITAPADNSTFAKGASVTLTVNAQAPGGTIAKVEYFANGQSLAVVTKAPYSLTVPNVPEAAYIVTAKITDGRGVTVGSAPIKVIVGNPKKVYFVTADPGPLTFAGDQAVADHLLQRGFNVITARGSDVPDDGSTAVGNDLIIESSSLGSGTVEIADPSGGPNIGKFKTLAIPAIDWEASSSDAWGFLDANPATGTSDGQTDINIVDASSPLAAGFPAGPLTVVSSPQTFSQSTPVGAHIVAQKAGDNTQMNLFYYEKGDKGYGGFVMPERRVFFFFQDNTAAAANAAGWKLFDAAVDWALHTTSTGGGGTDRPTVSLALNGATLTISSSGGGTVQATDSLNPSNWTDLGSAPQTVQNTGKSRFFRIKK